LTKDDIILKTAAHVQKLFSGDVTGHDWWHMYRVWQLAKTIAANEAEADMYTIELAALLHDIADWKFHNGDMEAGPQAARRWLASLDVEETIIVVVEDILRNVSYKGAGVASSMTTIEGKIVHDADKLDALGAIGIARAFAYGGANNRSIYDPDVKPRLHTSFESYKKDTGHTVNHFYEKLLLLKDRMYTDTGKKLASERHAYVEVYLEQFLAEWDGSR
jgi:uncharacterized protein